MATRSPDPQIPSLIEPVRGTHLAGFLAYVKRVISDLAEAHLSIKTIESATYTLVLGDDGKYLRFTSSSAVTVTVPPASTTQFRDGAVFHLRQAGAGQITVAQGNGVTVTTAATLKARVQHSSLMLVHVTGDTYDLLGDLEV